MGSEMCIRDRLFGLIPLAAFVPVFILGGVVLFPVFVYGISIAFSGAGE